MPSGKIKKLVQDKGFGFIQTNDGGDVFFHHSSVENQAFEELRVGQEVEYDIDQGNSGGGKGPRAANVRPL